jgi:hypothetical protein
MTQIKEKAVDLINRIPDDKVTSIIAFLQQCLENEANTSSRVYSKNVVNDDEPDLKRRREARTRFFKLRDSLNISIPSDFDYKKALHEAWDEKYGYGT